MPQTIQALLAILIVTLLAISQQQGIVNSYRDMADDEAEVMATAIALQSMEYIGKKDFDFKTRDHAIVTSESQLTYPFPTGKKCDVIPPIETAGGFVACESLEDFNQMQTLVVPFKTSKGQVLFNVSAEVTYVDDNQKPVTTRTFSKQVSIVVNGYSADGKTPVLKQAIRLPRVFAYGSE